MVTYCKTQNVDVERNFQLKCRGCERVRDTGTLDLTKKSRGPARTVTTTAQVLSIVANPYSTWQLIGQHIVSERIKGQPSAHIEKLRTFQTPFHDKGNYDPANSSAGPHHAKRKAFTQSKESAFISSWPVLAVSLCCHKENSQFWFPAQMFSKAW